MFFFEKKEPKNFSRVLRTLKTSAPQAFQRWNACGAGVVAPAGGSRAKHVVAKPRHAPGKVFCFFFSKKKRFLLLPFIPDY
jgi:hypothetical protein